MKKKLTLNVVQLLCSVLFLYLFVTLFERLQTVYLTILYRLHQPCKQEINLMHHEKKNKN